MDCRDIAKKIAFEINYQEIISFSQVVGVEALARFEVLGRSENETRSTYEIIKELEQTGEIVSVGYDLIRKVFSDVEKLTELYGADLIISINISPAQLKEKEFISFVKREILKMGINPTRIELEVTENIEVDDYLILENICTLSQLGFRIAIDDFGTGYSSMRYISLFPCDTVKIDGFFISDLKNPKTYSIVENISKLCSALGIKVIAEHVEESWQVERLLEIGIGNFQGFLYSKPMPIKSLTKKIPFKPNNFSVTSVKILDEDYESIVMLLEEKGLSKLSIDGVIANIDQNFLKGLLSVCSAPRNYLN